VEKKKMVDLCRKMRKLGLQHMCDIKGSASIKADSEARSGRNMGPIDGPIIVGASGNRTF
jgi:hypothetical protein